MAKVKFSGITECHGPVNKIVPCIIQKCEETYRKPTTINMQQPELQQQVRLEKKEN